MNIRYLFLFLVFLTGCEPSLEEYIQESSVYNCGKSLKLGDIITDSTLSEDFSYSVPQGLYYLTCDDIILFLVGSSSSDGLIVQVQESRFKVNSENRVIELQGISSRHPSMNLIPSWNAFTEKRKIEKVYPVYDFINRDTYIWTGDKYKLSLQWLKLGEGSYRHTITTHLSIIYKRFSSTSCKRG
ncbi:MAG: hypothetical protein RLN90_09715 [Balneolaceae bacterium]